MKKIITIGSAIQDIFLSVKANTILHQEVNNHDYWLIEEGSKIGITQIHTATGGGATNAAAALTLLGHQVFPVCKIAHDQAGAFIMHNLNSYKIDTRFVSTTQQVNTGTSCILTAEEGKRILFTHRGANEYLQEDDIPWNFLINECAGIYITALTGNASSLLERIVATSHKAGLFIACNPGLGQLEDNHVLIIKLLPIIDLFMLNEEEAELFFKQVQPITPFSYDAYFDYLLQQGARTLIITCGAEGVHIANNEERFFHKAYHPKKIINTVGAGDAFGSCLFGLLISGYDLNQAVEYAVINSTSVLQGRDAKEGLLSIEKLK